MDGCDDNGVPHEAQNLAPNMAGVPHFEHRTSLPTFEAVELSDIAVRESDGLVPGIVAPGAVYPGTTVGV